MDHLLFLIIVPVSVVIALSVIAFSHFNEKIASSSIPNRRSSKDSAMTAALKNKKSVIADALGSIVLFADITARSSSLAKEINKTVHRELQRYPINVGTVGVELYL